mmetsp:Transcript_32096/g.47225  ORF Transcript_32096/g.47225 Transcript_32096/m.47225 type:complete len:145 (-) Transcript_32096:188-622(-)
MQEQKNDFNYYTYNEPPPPFNPNFIDLNQRYPTSHEDYFFQLSNSNDESNRRRFSGGGSIDGFISTGRKLVHSASLKAREINEKHQITGTTKKAAHKTKKATKSAYKAVKHYNEKYQPVQDACHKVSHGVQFVTRKMKEVSPTK